MTIVCIMAILSEEMYLFLRIAHQSLLKTQQISIPQTNHQFACDSL